MRKILAIMLSLTLMFSMGTSTAFAEEFNSCNCTRSEQDNKKWKSQYEELLTERNEWRLRFGATILAVGGVLFLRYNSFFKETVEFLGDVSSAMYGTVKQRLDGINDKDKLAERIRNLEWENSMLLKRDENLVKKVNQLTGINLPSFLEMLVYVKKESTPESKHINEQSDHNLGTPHST